MEFLERRLQRAKTMNYLVTRNWVSQRPPRIHSEPRRAHADSFSSSWTHTKTPSGLLPAGRITSYVSTQNGYHATGTRDKPVPTRNAAGEGRVRKANSAPGNEDDVPKVTVVLARSRLAEHNTGPEFRQRTFGQPTRANEEKLIRSNKFASSWAEVRADLQPLRSGSPGENSPQRGSPDRETAHTSHTPYDVRQYYTRVHVQKPRGRQPHRDTRRVRVVAPGRRSETSGFSGKPSTEDLLSESEWKSDGEDGHDQYDQYQKTVTKKQPWNNTVNMVQNSSPPPKINSKKYERELTFKPAITTNKEVYKAYVGKEKGQQRVEELALAQDEEDTYMSPYADSDEPDSADNSPSRCTQERILNKREAEMYIKMSNVYGSDAYKNQRKEWFLEKLAKVQLEKEKHKNESKQQKLRTREEKQLRQHRQLKYVRDRFRKEQVQRFKTQYVTSRVLQHEQQDRGLYGLPEDYDDPNKLDEDGKPTYQGKDEEEMSVDEIEAMMKEIEKGNSELLGHPYLDKDKIKRPYFPVPGYDGKPFDAAKNRDKEKPKPPPKPQKEVVIPWNFRKKEDERNSMWPDVFDKIIKVQNERKDEDNTDEKGRKKTDHKTPVFGKSAADSKQKSKGKSPTQVKGTTKGKTDRNKKDTPGTKTAESTAVVSRDDVAKNQEHAGTKTDQTETKAKPIGSKDQSRETCVADDDTSIGVGKKSSIEPQGAMAKPPEKGNSPSKTQGDAKSTSHQDRRVSKATPSPLKSQQKTTKGVDNTASSTTSSKVPASKDKKGQAKSEDGSKQTIHTKTPAKDNEAKQDRHEDTATTSETKEQENKKAEEEDVEIPLVYTGHFRQEQDKTYHKINIGLQREKSDAKQKNNDEIPPLETDPSFVEKLKESFGQPYKEKEELKKPYYPVPGYDGKPFDMAKNRDKEKPKPPPKPPEKEVIIPWNFRKKEEERNSMWPDVFNKIDKVEKEKTQDSIKLGKDKGTKDKPTASKGKRGLESVTDNTSSKRGAPHKSKPPPQTGKQADSLKSHQDKVPTNKSDKPPKMSNSSTSPVIQNGHPEVASHKDQSRDRSDSKSTNQTHATKDRATPSRANTHAKSSLANKMFDIKTGPTWNPRSKVPKMEGIDTVVITGKDGKGRVVKRRRNVKDVVKEADALVQRTDASMQAGDATVYNDRSGSPDVTLGSDFEVDDDEDETQDDIFERLRKKYNIKIDSDEDE